MISAVAVNRSQSTTFTADLLNLLNHTFWPYLTVYLQALNAKNAVLPSISTDAVIDALNNQAHHDSTDSMAVEGVTIDVKTTGRDIVSNVAGSSNRSNGNGLFAGKKILIVDDAISILKLMTQTLKNKAEAIITQAKDGQQAVEECEKQHFDLILTDIQMPVLDGFGEAKRIRAIEKERGLPRKIIVGISANTQVTSLDFISQWLRTDIYITWQSFLFL